MSEESTGYGAAPVSCHLHVAVLAKFRERDSIGWLHVRLLVLQKGFAVPASVKRRTAIEGISTPAEYGVLVSGND